MNPLIAVTGYKNSGKNAVCNVLHNHYGYTITGFADVLKAMAYDINPWIVKDARLQEVIRAFGWDSAKEIYPEVRRFLQYLGTEGGRRHLGENVWVDAWKRNITPMLDLAEVGVCVSDMRFLNEAAGVRDLGGICWRVKRPGYVAGEHASELEQDQIRVEALINNDHDLDYLAGSVAALMNMAQGGVWA